LIGTTSLKAKTNLEQGRTEKTMRKLDVLLCLSQLQQSHTVVNMVLLLNGLQKLCFLTVETVNIYKSPDLLILQCLIQLWFGSVALRLVAFIFIATCQAKIHLQ
jgi:hypothetical protein